MTTLKDVQLALLARGFDIGKYGADGDLGPSTLGAMMAALGRLPVVSPPASPGGSASPGYRVVPESWMPWARMRGIVVHWNAGGLKASSVDRKHYHIIIEDDGNLVRGDRTIKDNESAADGVYAAHTKNCNTGFIGVALCGMLGARQSPFDPGKKPITRAEWERLPLVLADLCRRYAINVTPTTVLSHAEVQGTLGIPQNGKWDIAILPFQQSLNTAKKVGDSFRAATKNLL